MFPESENSPAGLPQQLVGLTIPLPIGFDLVSPVLGIRFGLSGMCRAAMPKTSVDKHRHFDTSKNHVRSSAKSFERPLIDSVSEAAPMYAGPDREFGAGITASVALHRLAGRWR